MLIGFWLILTAGCGRVLYQDQWKSGLYSFNYDDVLIREIDPMRSVMKHFNMKESLIISANTVNEWTTEDGIIKAFPAWKWVMENEGFS